MGKECCSTDQNSKLVYHSQVKSDDSVKNQNYSNDSHGHGHDHSDDHDHDHDHSTQTAKSLFQLFLPAIISGSLLLAGLGVDYLLKPHWFSGWFRILWYLAAYLPVGTPVIKEAWQSFRHSDFFSEFLLMTIATVGAFGIAEYPEAVAVMLFYSVGEAFQGMAVQRARKNIKNLLDSRPDEVTVLEKGIPKTINAEIVEIGQVIQLKPGEKLALDGELLSEMASFNTSALTGESKPNSKKKGDPIFAGMINLNRAAEIKVTSLYADSKLAKILDLVQNATSQKAPTELFIRKFAKIYTPIVVFLALGIVLIPYFFDEFYTFQKWLYRSLVFLVISCPCALVISIPLGYFGGIGAASKNGILIKGSNFLDILAKIQHVVLDKTGTLTQGVFEVQDIFIKNEFNQDQILQYLNLLESKSTHPIATAIHNFVGKPDHSLKLENTEEIAGHGLRGFIEGKEMLAGNFK